MRISIVAEERLRRLVSSLERALREQGAQVNSLLVQPVTSMSEVDRRFSVERFLHQANELSARLIVLSPSLLRQADIQRLQAMGDKPLIWVEEPARDLNKYLSEWMGLEAVLVNCLSSVEFEGWDNRCQVFPWWERDEDLAALCSLAGDSGRGLAYVGHLDIPRKRQRYFELAGFPYNVAVYGNTAPDYLRIGNGNLDRPEDWNQVKEGSNAVLLDLDVLGGDPVLSSPFIFATELGLPFFVTGATGRESLPPGVTAISDLRDIAEFFESSGNEMIAGGSPLTERSTFAASVRAEQLLKLLETSARDTDDNEIIGRAPDLVGGNCFEGLHFGEGEHRKRSLALIGTGFGRESSRIAAIKRSLEMIGHDLLSVDAEGISGLLQRDSKKVCRYQINVSPLLDELTSSGVDLIVFAGINARLTDASKQLLDDSDIQTICVDDTFSRWGEHLAQLSLSFDAVFTSSAHRVKCAQMVGFPNVHYLPHFVNPDFMRALSSVSERHGIVKVRRSIEREYELAPGLGVDSANILDSNIHHFQHLLELSLSELAETLSCETLLLSHEGHLANPAIHELMPYAWLAAEEVYFPRNSDTDEVEPYASGSTWVREIGELSKKFRNVKPRGKQSVPWSAGITDGPAQMKRVIEFPKDNRPRALQRKGAMVTYPVEPPAGYSGPLAVLVEAPELDRSAFNWVVSLNCDGLTSGEVELDPGVQFLITNYSDTNPIKLTVKYVGLNVCAPLAVPTIAIEVSPATVWVGDGALRKILARKVKFVTGHTHSANRTN